MDDVAEHRIFVDAAPVVLEHLRERLVRAPAHAMLVELGDPRDRRRAPGKTDRGGGREGVGETGVASGGRPGEERPRRGHPLAEGGPRPGPRRDRRGGAGGEERAGRRGARPRGRAVGEIGDASFAVDTAVKAAAAKEALPVLTAAVEKDASIEVRDKAMRRIDKLQIDTAVTIDILARVAVEQKDRNLRLDALQLLRNHGKEQRRRRRRSRR